MSDRDVLHQVLALLDKATDESARTMESRIRVATQAFNLVYQHLQRGAAR